MIKASTFPMIATLLLLGVGTARAALPPADARAEEAAIVEAAGEPDCAGGAPLLLAGLLTAVTPAAAEPATIGAPTHIAQQLYLNALARVARGNPAGAVAPFQVLAEVAPELPSLHHSLAYAMLLADFARR